MSRLGFPTAHEVAVAIVAGARLHGEDPAATVQGAAGHRGRWLAFFALQNQFGEVLPSRLATLCGFAIGTAKQATYQERTIRKASWWRVHNFDAVEAALAAAIALTDADAERVGRLDRIKAFVKDESPPAIDAEPIAPRSCDHIRKTARGHVVDHRVEGVVDLGDPPPGRSALDRIGR